MDIWNCWIGWGFKLLIPIALAIVFFELIIRRNMKSNKKVYDEYLKNAESVNQKVFQNQQEMIIVLKEIRDLLKTKN